MAVRSKWQSLPTEAINPSSLGIDKLAPEDIVDLMISEDRKVLEAVKRERERIAVGIDMIATSLRKGGRIVFNRSMSTVTCTMRNYSEGGARLEVASVLGIPESIDLKLDGHPSRSALVVWRKTNAIGVQFTAF